VPTRLLLLSDTHVPQRARELGDETWRMIDDADVVIHAGDWTGHEFFTRVRDRAGELIAVWGNNDGDELRAELPEFHRFELDGVRFALTHILADAATREKAAIAAAPDADVFVYGHSHIPWNAFTPGGMQLLNPGSPTDRRMQPHYTVMTAVADAGELRDVQLVPVER
jgi:uncharacterized protein